MPRAKTIAEPADPESTAQVDETPAIETQTPAPEPVVETQEAAPFSLRNVLAEKGYNTADFPDDAAAAAVLLRSHEEAQQIRQQYAPYKDRIQRYATHEEQFNKWLADQEKQKPAAAPEPQPGDWDWKPPEWNPAWAKQIDRNSPTGFREGADPVIVAKIEAYADWVREKNQEFLHDPRALIQKAVSGDLKKLRAEILQEARQSMAAEMQQRQQQDALWQHVQERQKEYFVHDATGRMLAGVDGQPARTPIGEAFRYYNTSLAQQIPDEAQRLDFIVRQIDLHKRAGDFGVEYQPSANGSGSTAAAADEPVRDKKGRFVERLKDSVDVIPDDPTAISANPERDLALAQKKYMQEQGIT